MHTPESANNTETLDTANANCRILLNTLLARGVRNLVLSPGSRNAPLLIGASCRPFTRRIINDERTAAFVALGLAVAQKSPSALICTSGTALYNYAPAVAEAYYQSMPLIVISADRPMEWIDQDDSQTLRQPDALAKIVKASFDIPVSRSSDPEMEWFVNRTVNEAVNTATSGIPGPVHINIRLDNPLTQTIPYAPASPRVVEITDSAILPPHIVKELAAGIAGKKIMVTCGFLPPDEKLNRALSEFNRLPNVKIMAETLSNLHIGDDNCEIDTVLSALDHNDTELIESLRPDVVISIGGALVSRKLKEFIRRFKPAEHWTLGDTRLSVDCFRALTRHIEIAPHRFFTPMAKVLARRSGATVAYREQWQQVVGRSRELHDSFLDSIAGEWCELTAYRHILGRLPQTWNLFLSNGTPVRYAQLFTRTLPHASFSCRGVSGIDGTTATAAGIACSYSGSTLLITGDMSFAYDTGVLGINNLPAGFKIIVINNQGGGIFRFIDSTRRLPQREEFFCADPAAPIEGIARAYGWEYASADSLPKLEAAFDTLLRSAGNMLLEVRVDGELSADLLTEFLSLRL